MAATISGNDDEPLVFTNYKSTLHERFTEMFHKREFTDAILICENQRIHVHKFLLSASSSFFNKMFKSSKNARLDIKNVKYTDLVEILEYIYSGKVELHPNRVHAFIDATNKLSIPLNSSDINAISTKYGIDFSQINTQITSHDDKCENGCNDIVKKPQVTTKPDLTDAIHINKHNLNDETLKSLTPGIIEVSREEFLERMFNQQALPWPGNTLTHT